MREKGLEEVHTSDHLRHHRSFQSFVFVPRRLGRLNFVVHATREHQPVNGIVLATVKDLVVELDGIDFAGTQSSWQMREEVVEAHLHKRLNEFPPPHHGPLG
jgi:hypothetical protein